MSHYKHNDPETWLPNWARGKGLTVQVVRLKSKDGSVTEVVPDEADEIGDVADERCQRHLDADPRFTKL